MSTILTAQIRKVDNRRDPERPYSLAWQTPLMPAPAFSYFATEAAARVEAAALIMQEKPEPAPPPHCPDALIVDYFPHTIPCTLPSGHDGAHQAGRRRWN